MLLAGFGSVVTAPGLREIPTVRWQTKNNATSRGGRRTHKFSYNGVETGTVTSCQCSAYIAVNFCILKRQLFDAVLGKS